MDFAVQVRKPRAQYPYPVICSIGVVAAVLSEGIYWLRLFTRELLTVEISGTGVCERKIGVGVWVLSSWVVACVSLQFFRGSVWVSSSWVVACVSLSSWVVACVSLQLLRGGVCESPVLEVRRVSLQFFRGGVCESPVLEGRRVRRKYLRMSLQTTSASLKFLRTN